MLVRAVDGGSCRAAISPLSVAFRMTKPFQDEVRTDFCKPEVTGSIPVRSTELRSTRNSSPSPKPEFVPALAPCGRELCEPFPHRGRQSRRMLMFGDRNGIVEEDHQPVTGKMLNCSLRHLHEFARKCVISPI